MEIKISDLTTEQDSVIWQVARLLVDGFKVTAPGAFPDLVAAIAEIRESFGADRLSRVALDEHGNAVGWIGGISHYSGHTWELHPLVFRSDRQRRGIRRALVADLERWVAERGGGTSFPGTDEEQHQTSVSGVDLYSDTKETRAKHQKSCQWSLSEFGRARGQFPCAQLHLVDDTDGNTSLAAESQNCQTEEIMAQTPIQGSGE
jgi:aminoglycoside 6'-N-acetyltransferase I